MIRRLPRSTLFPYTTLVRSVERLARGGDRQVVERLDVRVADARARAHDHHRPAVLRLLQLGKVVLADQHLADRKSTRLNSSHANISYAAFCLKKNKQQMTSL